MTCGHSSSLRSTVGSFQLNMLVMPGCLLTSLLIFSQARTQDFPKMLCLWKNKPLGRWLCCKASAGRVQFLQGKHVEKNMPFNMGVCVSRHPRKLGQSRFGGPLGSIFICDVQACVTDSQVWHKEGRIHRLSPECTCYLYSVGFVIFRIFPSNPSTLKRFISKKQGT